MHGKWIRRTDGDLTVVFVHGFLSSDEGCWRHDNGTHWPTLLARESDAGVYVFEYKTTLFSGNYRLGDVVDSLKENLALDGVVNASRLIFVCHSMGGIVVRRYITERAADLIGRNTQVGLYLIASPSLGSAYGNWLAPLAQALRHSQADALRFQQSNAWLMDLDREFLNLKESARLSLSGKELVEDQFVIIPKLWRRQVVEPFSGARYFGEPYKVPNSDHFSVAKVANSSAIQHRMLIKFIADTRAKKSLNVSTTTSTTKPNSLPHGSSSQQDPLEKTFGVPAITRQMLPRASQIDISKALRPDSQRAGRATCVLLGTGGSGKTTLAALTANDPDLHAHYPDGIYWVSLGQDPDIAARQASWVAQIPSRSLIAPDRQAAAAFLSQYFRDRRALLVVDDVWDLSDFRFFDVGGPQCGLIITTREVKISAGVDGQVIPVGSLTPQESVHLLQVRSGVDLGSELNPLAAALGHLPLALELAAFQLKDGVGAAELCAALSSEKNTLYRLDVPGYQHESDVEVAKNLSLTACLNLSLRRLSQEDAGRFARLSVLDASDPFDATVADALWRGNPPSDAAKTLNMLRAMSLIELAGSISEAGFTRYRVHSVLRARAREMLTAPIGGKDKLGQGLSVKAALLDYLETVNPAFPTDWHCVSNAAYLRRNVVTYLVQASCIPALLAVLRQKEGQGDVLRPNAWCRCRESYSELEGFTSDVEKIARFFSHRTCEDISEFSGLVLSGIALRSMRAMTEAIDLNLCLALVKSGLWSEGAAVEHAKRCFKPGQIAELAQGLAEPLRSATVEDAIRLAAADLNSASTASELIQCGLAYQGNLKRRVLAGAILTLERHLSNGASSGDEIANVRASRLVRAAIKLFREAPTDVIGDWTPAGWVESFARSARDWQPMFEQAGTRSRFQEDYDCGVLGLETLIAIACGEFEEAASLARTELKRIFLMIRSRNDYGIQVYKIISERIVEVSDAELRFAALAALNGRLSRFYNGLPWEHRVGRFDGIEGLADLAMEQFGSDPSFVKTLLEQEVGSLARSAYLQRYLTAKVQKTGFDALEEGLSGQTRAVIYNVFASGSLFGPGASPMDVSEDDHILIATLAEGPLIRERVTGAGLMQDLRLVRNEHDRIRLVETLLPAMPALDTFDAENLCRSFSDLERAARARIALGARVASVDRGKFLEAAIRDFQCADASITALDALSRYMNCYTDEEFTVIARAASGFARKARSPAVSLQDFAAASLAMNPLSRKALLRSAFWYEIDTMPTHAPIEPIALARSLISTPFWRADKYCTSVLEAGGLAPVASLANVADDSVIKSGLAKIDATSSDDAFRRCAVAYIKLYAAQETKNWHDLSDIALEFAMRGDTEYCSAIASAIHDAALMYN